VGLVVSEIKQNIFHFTNSLFVSGLTTAQAVDPLRLYRDFPAPMSHYLLMSAKMGRKIAVVNFQENKITDNISIYLFYISNRSILAKAEGKKQTIHFMDMNPFHMQLLLQYMYR
jgi:hypothetical protein